MSNEYDNEFFQLLEDYEQEVLRLARFVDSTPIEDICRKCGKEFGKPGYLQHDVCPGCDPPITLEPDTFDSLLQEKREQFFASLSELDERFRSQPTIALRDKVLDEMEHVRKWAEAASVASEMLEEPDVTEATSNFSSGEFATLVENLLRIRSAERLGLLFGLDEETVDRIIEKRIEVLFGRKPPRQLQVTTTKEPPP